MINELYELKNTLNEIENIKYNYGTIKKEIDFLENEHIHNFNKKITSNIYKFVILFLLVAIFFNEPFLILTNLLLFAGLYFFTFRIIPNISIHTKIKNISIDIYMFLMLILIIRLIFKLSFNLVSDCILILLTTVILNKFIVPFIISTFFSKRIEKIDNSQKISDLENKLNNLSNQFTLLENRLNNSSIPLKYRNLNAINFFIDCLNTKRADTLKELVNLYENELRYQKDKEQYQKEINNLKNEISKTRRIANKAKSDANMSIFISRFK